MRHKKTPEQQQTEYKIIGHVLAAFTEATDYEPETKSLVMRVDYDEDEKTFKTCVYNDAFKDEDLKPIEARGHFNEVQDVKEYRDQLTDTISITQKAKTATLPDVPPLYDPQELLDIYDEAVEVLVQRISRGCHENRTRATLFKLQAAEIKDELRRQFMKGAKV